MYICRRSALARNPPPYIWGVSCSFVFFVPAERARNPVRKCTGFRAPSVCRRLCCFNTVSMLFQYCFNTVSILFQYCFNAVSYYF